MCNLLHTVCLNCYKLMQNLPLTKVVDQLMEQKSNPETDDYRYFDPKLLRPTDKLVY